MREEFKECRHCGSSYRYQSSGMGCDHATNDSRYCPGCMEVINAALAKVPRRFEHRWIEHDATWDWFESRKGEYAKVCRERRAANPNGIFLTPVWPSPLYKEETGELDVNHLIEVDGVGFRRQYWPRNKDGFKIYRHVLVKIATGKVVRGLPL